jgi:ATP-dependent Lon protease
MSKTLDFRVPDVLPPRLSVVPLRRGVLLPGTVHRFGVGRAISNKAIARAADGWLLVAVQRDPVAEPMPSDLLPVATLARVLERTERGVVLQGFSRVTLTGFSTTRPYMEASYERLHTPWPTDSTADALKGALDQGIETTAALVGKLEEARASLLRLSDPGLRADAVAGRIESPEPWRREYLQTASPTVRVEKLLQRLAALREVLAAQRTIQERVRNQARGIQKEHVLRQQLKAIQEELGEGSDDDDLTRLKDRLDEAALPEEVRDTVDRELRRLGRINPQSPERSVAIDWLEWVADMPWDNPTAVDVDLDTLQRALDGSHHGLDEVKRQVLEHLAVRKLAGRGRADVLLLVGPPGVGKTSIGNAIAEATGRKLVRVALGGVSDEAELRGHRRTYIGARPGRLVEGIRRAGTSDPVVLLDELDKVGRGHRGDPTSALLEILDPEQNHAFTDHYLEVPFDLSRVLFVATANDLSTIPGPLRDRLEIIQIAGYSPAEKLAIAREHLLDKLAENAGLEPQDVALTDGAIADAIDGWTRESGVRSLQRVLGRVYRAAAVKKARGELDEPLFVEAEDLPVFLKRRRFRTERHSLPDRAGFATGLAWTPVGGSVLYIEASRMPGTGRLVLTGQLGDVMKESARAALTYVLSNHEALGIAADAMRDHDLHVHVPAGGVPKDGPSAGVTMFTAIASLLSGRPVAEDLAMTGEASLRGRVLPVGGIKSKVLGAHQRGITTVVLPRDNEPDLEDVPEEIRRDMRFVLVDHMSQVLEVAFAEPEQQLASKAS